jgi:hypothetical protein
MRCEKCSSELVNGYCPKCGIKDSVKSCANGHVLDPAWTECPYCSPVFVGTSSPAFNKGRTVIETPAASKPFSGGDIKVQPGGFTKGATLLDGGNTPGIHLGGGMKKGDKPKTIYDPGDTAPAAAISRLPKLVGWLVSFTNDPSGQDYRVREGRNSIGSDGSKCDVIIHDATVSSIHALLIYQGGVFMIRDEGSNNGTFVNGENIFIKGGGVSLKQGDRIRIGKTELVLYVI